MKARTLQHIFRLLLGAAMVLAGVGHLTFQRLEFRAQVPEWITADPAFIDFIVIASGVVEIMLGLGLLFATRYRVAFGMALAIFFVAIFPGNIAQYVQGTDAFGLDTDAKRLIRLFFQPLLVLWALWASGALHRLIETRREKKAAQKQRFHDFAADDIRGNATPMNQFKGNVVLVVNTASQCGLTPQYEGLERLYQAHGTDGLVILGFPCNQFAGQEKGSNEEIAGFCQLNYGVSFPMFAKIDVNGPATHPIFAFLKHRLGGFPTKAIKWNFTKFLIDRDGNPVKRYAPITKPEQLEADIKHFLQK